MALPAGIDLVKVKFGPFLDYQGNPVAGTVTFTPPRDLLHAASGSKLLPAPIAVSLGPDGANEILLPATDNSSLSPRDFTYTVQFSIRGMSASTVAISLPGAIPEVDLELMQGVPASTGMTVQVPAVQSVNGQTGIIVIDAVTATILEDALAPKLDIADAALLLADKADADTVAEALATKLDEADLAPALEAQRTAERAHAKGTYAALDTVPALYAYEAYLDGLARYQQDLARGALVYKNAVQSIPNNTSTVVAWQADVYDYFGYHDPAGLSGRLTIPPGMGGVYEATAFVEWGNGQTATGRRILHLRINGGAFADIHDQAGLAGGYTRSSVKAQMVLNDGDYVEVVAYQDSGVALSLNAAVAGNATLGRPNFALFRKGGVNLPPAAPPEPAYTPVDVAAQVAHFDAVFAANLMTVTES